MGKRTRAAVQPSKGDQHTHSHQPAPGSTGFFSFIVNFVQFLFYRTLHLWEESSKYARLIINPHREVRSSFIGYIVRYIILPANAIMTYYTIKAQQDDDTDLFRQLVYWGFIPSTIRTVAAMWSSTIDRQFAKDQEQRNNVLVDLINVQRRSMGVDLDVKGGGCFLFNLAKLVPGVDHPESRKRETVNTPRRLFKRYNILATLFERPINYAVQKVTIAILLFLWFYPDAIDNALEVAVVCRYIRIVTTVILAPLNHYLGHLRRNAMLEIRDEYLAIFIAQNKQLHKLSRKKGASKVVNTDRTDKSAHRDVVIGKQGHAAALAEIVTGTQEGDYQAALTVIDQFEQRVDDILAQVVDELSAIFTSVDANNLDMSDETEMFLDNTDSIREADRFYVRAREAHRWAHSCQQVITETRLYCEENAVELKTLVSASETYDETADTSDSSTDDSSDDEESSTV